MKKSQYEANLLFCLFFILLSQNVNSQKNQQCAFGQFLTKDYQCLQCLTSSNCAKCKSLLSQQCQNCPQAYQLIQKQKKCVACPANQLHCDFNQTICQPHYRVLQQVSICVPKCQIPGCRLCKSISTNFCQLCLDGYVLEQHNCVKKKRFLQNDDNEYLSIEQLQQRVKNMESILSLARIQSSGKSSADSQQTIKNLQKSIDSLKQLIKSKKQNRQPNQKTNQSSSQQETDPNLLQRAKKLAELVKQLQKKEKQQELERSQAAAKNLQKVIEKGKKQRKQKVEQKIQQIQSKCKIGEYQSNSKCLPCLSKCLTCYNTADQCLQCANGWKRQGWKCINQIRINFTMLMKQPESRKDFIQHIQNDIYRFKSQFIQTVLPQEYRNFNSSIVTIQQIQIIEPQKMDNRTYNILNITGSVDKMTYMNIAQVYKKMVANLKQLNKIHNFPIETYQLTLVNDDKDFDVGDQPWGQGKMVWPMKLKVIIIASIIGLVCLCCVLPIALCYKCKKCCFRKKQVSQDSIQRQKDQKVTMSTQRKRLSKQNEKQMVDFNLKGSTQNLSGIKNQAKKQQSPRFGLSKLKAYFGNVKKQTNQNQK